MPVGAAAFVHSPNQLDASDSPEDQLPISDRICDCVAIFAALWTIACNAAVATAGSLHNVLLNFGVLTAIGAVILLLIRRRRSTEVPPSPSVSPPDFTTARGSVRGALPVTRILGSLLGAVALLLYAATDDILYLWWASVGVLSFALVSGAIAGRQPEPVEPPRRTRCLETLLWAMGAACTLIVLTFHYADYDSAFYVSMAVAAADSPGAPLMLDTIHGVEGLGLHIPAYRVHSFEIFSGALSHLTGLPAILCYQVVTAAVMAFLVPLGFARLFRLLTPRHWHWAVLAVLVVLVGAGSTTWWYGNFSIVRIFHGKSVYMSFFLPLAYAYGLRFGSKPTGRRWLPLFAVQIAAVGCTSSALWSVPIAACLAMTCSVRWDRSAIRTLVFGVLASSYVVGVGLTLVGDMKSTAALVIPNSSLGTDLALAFERTLGDGSLATAAIAALLLTWVLYRRGPAQRFATVVPLVVLVLVLNPYWSEQVSRHITGPSYWRSMWSLPLPILMALMLTSPLQFGRTPLRRKLASVAAALTIIVFVAFVPEFSALSRDNRVRFGGFTEIKAPIKWYALASALAQSVPEGSMVVAPQMVALWVPSFHHHPFVTYAREVYLHRIVTELGTEEADHRMLMSEVVSLPQRDIELRIRESEGFERRHRQTDLAARFREGLHRYHVRGVCINKRAPLYQAIRDVLQAESFVLIWMKYGYQVWIHSTDAAAKRPGTPRPPAGHE
jgi:hypothetical protein